jgi:Epoxide hydrolase N terminus
MATVETAAEIRPFHVDIPEETLKDLRRRIEATRWPSKELVEDRSQGVQLATLRELARYWATDYDWRKVEAELNALPQFETEVAHGCPRNRRPTAGGVRKERAALDALRTPTGDDVHPRFEGATTWLNSEPRGPAELRRRPEMRGSAKEYERRPQWLAKQSTARARAAAQRSASSG